MVGNELKGNTIIKAILEGKTKEGELEVHKGVSGKITSVRVYNQV